MRPLIPGSVGYVDESIHDEPGLYLVAVVYAVPDLAPRVGRELAELIPTATRPHWHAEDGPTRLRLVRALATLPVRATVYVCRFECRGHKEASRRRALRWLALDVPQDVRRLVLDRRQEKQDESDRKVLRGMAGRPPRFTVEHASSAKESLLWLSDILVGAAAARVTGRTGEYVAAVDSILDGVNIES